MPERIFFAGWLAARRTPSASIGEDGLPELPGASARMYVQNGYRRASVLPGNGSPLFTADQMRQYARDAVAADRRTRYVTVTNYGNPVDKCDRSQQAAQGVKTWQERCDWWSERSSTKLMVEAMKAEIAELRALLAAPPLSSEQQTDFRALVQSIIHDGYLSETNMHRGRAALDATAGEQQAEKGEK